MTRHSLEVTAVRLSRALGWLDLADRRLVGSYLAAHTRAPVREHARAARAFGPQHDLISNAAVAITSMAVLGAVICINPRKDAIKPPAAAPQVTGSQQQPIQPEPEESFGDSDSLAAPAAAPPAPAVEPVSPPAKIKPTSRARTTPKKREGCTPNFYFDAQGDKHWKPECF